ncbi:MAG: triosephosphate isomerase [Cellvibrionaceae bacterium]|jgi:triosephosphate isomerase
MRSSLIVGNWKMNGSRAENSKLLASIEAQLAEVVDAKLAVCVPFVYIPQISELLQGSNLSFGAQDLSAHVSGAYTGEVAPSMLNDFGCDYVIVGHSERRQFHQESDLLVAQKALAAFQSKLIPIVCLGESLDQREACETLDVVGRQLQAVQAVLCDEAMSKLVVAYEPVWAIGTGLTATPEQAQEVHGFIRQKLGSAGDKVSLLYGGSVKEGNAKALFSKPDIDGALVGGASLDADEFIQIAKAV